MPSPVLDSSSDSVGDIDWCVVVKGLVQILEIPEINLQAGLSAGNRHIR